MKHTPCSAEELSTLLRYEAETGNFYWRERPQEAFKTYRSYQSFRGKYVGKEAFTSVNVDGYKYGMLFGVMVRAHQVAWAMNKGMWPNQEIDHMDGDPQNNRIENLRLATRTDNNRNRAVAQNTATGWLGINFTHNGKYRVRLAGHYYGVFQNLAEAIVVRDKRLRELGFHANHGRVSMRAA